MFASLRSRLITFIGIGTTALFLVGSIATSLIFESSLWSEFDSALFDRARNLGQLIEQEEHGLFHPALG